MANPGDDAILFSEPDYLTGETFTLADHARELVVLAFEAIEWCHYCRIEVPILQQLWSEYQANVFQPKVQFVMINDVLDEQNFSEQLPQYNLTMPVLTDFDIMAYYEAYLLPTVVIIKPGLKICSIKKGAPGTDLEIRNDIIQRIFDCSTVTSLPERGSVVAAGNALSQLMEKYSLGKSAKMIFSREKINIQYGNESHTITRSELTAPPKPKDKKYPLKKMVRELLTLLKTKAVMLEEWLKKTYPKSYKDEMILYLGSEMRFQLGVLPVPQEIDFFADNDIAQIIENTPYTFKWNAYAAAEGMHTLSFRSQWINSTTRILVIHLG